MLTTISAGQPAAESLGGGTGVQVGRGGRGRRPREGNDERVDDLNGQGNNQGLGANGDVGNQGNIGNQNGNVVNENVQENVGNVLVNGNRAGCSYKELLGCNPKEYDCKGGVVVLTRWIEKWSLTFARIMSAVVLDKKGRSKRNNDGNNGAVLMKQGPEGDYGSGVIRPSINHDTHFELKGQFLKELRDITFSGLEHKDANEHIEKKWHNGTSSRTRSTKTSDGLAAIQAQLNNLGREIKKVNEKVYAAQVGCELCKGPHYTKDCPQKEEGKTLEEAYYTQFGAPYQPGGQYRAAGPRFYQQNKGNSSYLDRRTNLEESLTKFMAESAKRHEENSNIINGIRASTDATIRNQGASIKTMEIQIRKMSKVLQEKGFGSVPSSTETNPRDQHRSLFSEIVPSLRRLQNFTCDDWREAQDVKILDAYDHTLPQKEKDPRSFTLSYFIHNIYFDKALVDLGASVSVMPFSTYTNLGLGILSHTRLTIELAD
ncbi:DNA-directed DNA polymerase [Tanacetum coccineum]